MLAPLTFIANRISKRYGNATISLLDQGFVSAVNFLTIIILARYLSLEMFGVFMIAQTILTLLTGLQNSLVALPHNILGPQRHGLAYARLTIVLGLLQLILSIGLASIVAIGGVFLLANGHADSAYLAFALSLTVLPWMGQEFVRRVLYTQSDVTSAAVNDFVCYGLQLAGIVAVVMQTGGVNANPSNAMLALGLSSLIATAFGLRQLRLVALAKIAATELRSLRDFKIVTLETWQVSRWPMAQQVVAWFSASGHGWILAFFLGPASFGIYRAAYQVVNILNPFRQTAMNHLPSRAAHVYAAGGAQHLTAWTKKITLSLTIPFAIGALFISLAAEPLATLMYGAHEQISNLQLIVVLGALTYTINFARTPLEYAALIGGSGRALFTRSLLLMAFVLTGGVALIWSLGIYGAMLSEVVSACIVLILTMKIYSTARRNTRRRDVEVMATNESASPYGISSESPQAMPTFPSAVRGISP
jgi:O-antigen/teichoic acid export membrane protein